MDFVGEGCLVGLGALGGHVGSHSSRLEATDGERLHVCFLTKSLFLWCRKRVNLDRCNSSALNAGAAVNVKFKTALDMPLNPLTEPALIQALAHLKTDDLVFEAHEVVEDCDLSGHCHTIKDVPLHNIGCVVPLLILSDHLAALDGASECVVIA